MAGLSFIVREGGLSRNRPSEDGKVGFFALMQDEQFALDASATSVTEFFSFHEAKAWLLSYETIDSYATLLNVFQDIYSEQPNCHVYFRFQLVDDDPFATSMNNRIEDILNYSNNTIRQLLVYTNYQATAGMITDIQSRLTNRFNTTFCGVSAILAAGFNDTISPIAQAADRVAMCYAISSYNGVNVAGRLIGAVSRAIVHENIGWVSKFRLNVPEDYEFLLLSDDSEDIANLSKAQLDAILNAGKIIPTRIPDYSGWYWNDSKNANGFDSDFAYIENRRVMDKAVRKIKNDMMPLVSSPVYTDSSGKMTPEIVASFESLASKGLDQMQKDGEISGYSVYIDPSQNIVSSGVISVQVEIRPVGVARFIQVTIGFTL